MTTTTPPPAVDADKLMAFVFRAVDEVGATLNAALVVMGDKLGLYRALAGAGPLDAGRAGRAHRHRRALRPRVAERPGRGRLRRVRPGERPLHAAARAGRGAHRRGQPGLPARASSRSPSASCSTRRASSRPPARGAGVGWHEHNHDVFDGCERFFRPGYNANLVAVLAAGARRRGRASSSRGARVADVGCGHGASTILMAQAFPQLDLRRLRLPRRLDRDRPRPGQGGRASTSASASRSLRPRASRRSGYDLVTMFDCLHDMGDPVGRGAPRARRRWRPTAPG